ncbi:MAG: TolC family protein [Candidatus Scalindua sp.]|jgi:cobalt-zinc-cadmium efflux system outer membrane protein|nr:TolC family protein [Candidatus Scalindua sp.]MBT6051837.1 TolC family protein [Candidatus Scalindua sp.]MBT6564756.1 TolC family protein [Candidatus Scalindua sp.]MBT7211260.1 TolC family protein [Candidatus Scalindua sp.]MBT7591231.1 TolC family protein [Candidatus Scalindua sp.]
MIYPVSHIKSVTVITFIVSAIFLTSNVSLAQVSDPTQREETKAKTVNLKDCITIAYESNLQLSAARNRLGTAEADRIKASFLLPSNPKVISKVGERDGPDGARTTDYMVRLSQEFQVFGQRRKRINVSNKLIERVKFEISDLERNVIAKVKTNFYEVLTFLEIVKLREYAENIFERIHSASVERYKAGAISALELNSMKIKYGVARQQLLVANNNYENSLLDMKLILGKPRDEALTIDGKLSYEELKISIDDILASAYKTRPDLKAAELEKERASKEISLRKAEIFPNPTLSGFFSREERTDDIVGGFVSISIPVWDRKQPELKKARTSKSTASINISNKRLQIQNDVATAYRTFTAAKQGIAIYTDDIMPQVNENLKLNEISYKEGKINFVGFLMMQSDLIETQTTYLEALLSYNNAIVNLEAASGVQLKILN